IRVGIPGRRIARGVQRGDSVPHLATDVREVTAHVHGAAADDQRFHTVVCVWIPSGNRAGGGVYGRNAVPRLALDEAKVPTDVHGGSARGQRPPRRIHGWVPLGRLSGRRVQRGDSVAHLPAHAREVPSRVDRTATHSQRIHGSVCIRVPRGHAVVALDVCNVVPNFSPYLREDSPDVPPAYAV